MRPALAGYCCGIAALLVFFACSSPRNAIADSETRTISFHHIHTKEDLTVTYKVNGRYNEEALTKINHLMRDWRESEPIKMDPLLIDLLWEVHREVGAKESIWIVCGYRSPSTNSALRRRSSGVAQQSQHMVGKAIDFYIPGVPLDQWRAAGLRAQRGGVGYYPTSGAPFVHMDTGSVRHWPRMPEEQLATVMAKGPLRYGSGTQVAQGEVQQRSSNPIALLAKLFGGGKDEEEDAETAAASSAPKVAAARITTRPAAKPAKPETYQVAAAGSMPVAKPADALASEASGQRGHSISARAGHSPEWGSSARDKPAETFELSSAASQPAPAPGGFGLASTTSKPAVVRPAQAASLVAQANIPTNDVISANDIINQRGYWQGLPNAEAADARPTPAPSSAPRRPAALASEASDQRGNSIVRASADPATTASLARWPLADRADSEPLPNALAYAAQPTPIAAARAVPMVSGAMVSGAMGSSTPRVAPAAAPAQTTVAAKRSDDRPSAIAPVTPPNAPNVVRVGDRFNDPWLRAMIVSPSAQSYMKTTLLGTPDFRNLGSFMQKPAATVMMIFSDNPHLGMTTETFAGSAVVFTPTVTFNAPRTAALR